VGFSFAANLLLLVVPLYMLQVYDRVIVSGSSATLTMLTLIAVVLLAVYGVTVLAVQRVLDGAALRFEECVARPLLALGIERRLRGGDWDRPFRDLDAVKQVLRGDAATAALDSLWVPAFLLLVFLFHPWLGAVALAGTVVLAGLALLQGRKMREAAERRAGGVSQSRVIAHGFARHFEAVIATGIVTELGRRWLGLRYDKTDAGAGALTALQRTVRLILQIALLGTGAALTIAGSISAGSIVATSILMWRALQPLERAAASFATLREGYDALRRLRGVEMLGAAPVRSHAIAGRLAMERITIAHPRTGETLFSNLSFDVAPGEVLGVVGPSGVGKTLLARIAVGLHPHQAGRVRLDDLPISIQMASLFSGALGYLPQDNALLEGTVAQNIARFRPAPMPDVAAAAQRARAADTIGALPDGYDTFIDPERPGLSGGQMRRIALARALFGDPRLVVLDEPTTHIDVLGEQNVLEAILEMRSEGRTVMLITHSSRLLAACDKLLVLRPGTAEFLDSRAQILRRLNGLAGNRSADSVSVVREA
jgi:PrtD family type I secretion system ABC transporter